MPTSWNDRALVLDDLGGQGAAPGPGLRRRFAQEPGDEVGAVERVAGRRGVDDRLDRPSRDLGAVLRREDHAARGTTFDYNLAGAQVEPALGAGNHANLAGERGLDVEGRHGDIGKPAEVHLRGQGRGRFGPERLAVVAVEGHPRSGAAQALQQREQAVPPSIAEDGQRDA